LPTISTPRQQTYKLVVSGLLFLWTLSIFLPGTYSIDSWNQWNEIAGGHYDDWYGTGLATTWRQFWKITGNYMCLYVVQMIAYWVFITMLLWRIPFKSVGYWGMLIYSLFFCFVAQYIMRDALTVLAWNAGAALLLVASRNPEYRKTAAIVGLLLLAYGLWVRINMLAALFPLVYAGLYLLGGQRIFTWKRLLLAGASCILVFAAIQVWTYKIQKAGRTYPDYKLKLLDLAGITKLSGENQFPPEFSRHPYFHVDSLVAEYTPASIDDVYWPTNGRPMFPYPNDSLSGLVSHSWHRAILRHPFYYLENRLSGFLYYLHIKKRFKVGEYWNVSIFFVQPNGPLPAAVEWSPMKFDMIRFYAFFNRTPIYDAWFWLLLNVIAFTLFTRNLIRRPKNEQLFWLVHAAIQLSGILAILSQVLIYQHDRDFRYTYWNCFVTLFALAALFTKNKDKAIGDAAPSK
jgi:hypothetical protein